MAKTTNIQLKGDLYAAEQLSLAHTDRLLLDFRKNTAFQNLKINAVNRNFYDSIGKFIGNIYIQTINGTENIIVNVPPPEIVIEEEKKEKRKETIIQVVPVIRSRDNQYWLACLSGTFDGPYYCFENIKDLSEDIFYQFALESSYHNKQISVGNAPFNGSLNPPELYLISATGEMPDEDGEHPEEYDWKDNDSYSSQYRYVGESIYLCPGLDLGGYRDDYSGESNNTQNELLYVFDNLFEDIEFKLITTTTLERAWVFCSTYQENITEQIVIDQCSDRDYLQIDESEFFSSNPPAGFEYENGLKTLVGESTTPWSDNYSIRAERGAIQNSSACYRKTTTDNSITTSLEFDLCDSDNTVDSDTETSVTYCDYILVDGNEFALRNLSSDPFPKFYQRDMRYYNTDRSIATTAIIASNKGNISTNYERWMYYYIGPNSEGQLHTTEFFPESGSLFHIIPNVAGIDDSVFFGGKIFLGMLKYEIER